MNMEEKKTDELSEKEKENIDISIFVDALLDYQYYLIMNGYNNNIHTCDVLCSSINHCINENGDWRELLSSYRKNSTYRKILKNSFYHTVDNLETLDVENNHKMYQKEILLLREALDILCLSVKNSTPT
jgi:hypothetical protein